MKATVERKSHSFSYAFAGVLLVMGVSAALITSTQWKELGVFGVLLSGIGLLAVMAAFVQMRLIFPVVKPVDGVYEFRVGGLGVVIMVVMWTLLALAVGGGSFYYIPTLSALDAGFWETALAYCAAVFLPIYSAYRAKATWNSRRDFISISKEKIETFDDRQGGNSYDANAIATLEIVRTQYKRNSDDLYALRVNGDHYELKWLNLNGYADQMRGVLKEYYPDKMNVKQ